MTSPATAAVVFDLDGVIVDSEHVWDEVRERYVLERGGRYGPWATRAMMGMSSTEWSRYIVEELGVSEAPERVNAYIVDRMLDRYGDDPPLIPGAVEAVRAIGARWPAAVASSSNPELIELVLRRSWLDAAIGVVVSSEEMARGKPAPDVYLEAARRLEVEPAACVAVEDSHNGIRSAHAAGMRVIAVPNPHFPPGEEVLAQADLVLASVAELTPEVVAAL